MSAGHFVPSEEIVDARENVKIFIIIYGLVKHVVIFDI